MNRERITYEDQTVIHLVARFLLEGALSETNCQCNEFPRDDSRRHLHENPGRKRKRLHLCPAYNLDR